MWMDIMKETLGPVGPETVSCGGEGLVDRWIRLFWKRPYHAVVLSMS